jgi:hypothetical protein
VVFSTLARAQSARTELPRPASWSKIHPSQESQTPTRSERFDPAGEILAVHESPVTSHGRGAIQAKMGTHTSSETCLRQTSAIVYCAIDTLLPLRGRPVPGFDDFSVALAHANVPCIWITSRTRAQIDDPFRKFGHANPFIGEGGSAVYIPEDYFHLRGERSERRGRFLCIPVAELQPAAAEALERLSEQTGVPVVPLRTLSPRELAQYSGLPQHEAELARQRAFPSVSAISQSSTSALCMATRPASDSLPRSKPASSSLPATGTFCSLRSSAMKQLCIRPAARV